VHLKSPHLVIEGSVVRVYCSAECKSDEGRETIDSGPGAAMFAGKLFVIGIGLASLSPLGTAQHPFEAALVARASAMAERESPSPDLDLAALPVYGPNPPTERDLAAQFVAEVSRDNWVHPLAGPLRRMPIRDSRVFGASRDGDRPGECRGGHCGVDLGDRWGEPVYAAHDGIVERVERRAKPNGGRYVRLAHRDGTIVTGYFHLAAIPRRLEPGVEVHAGEIIGILGETGIEHSDPHLHFAISVRPDPDQKREVYIDPEPLLALWPLKIPQPDGSVSADTRPGVPLGAATRATKKRRRHARSHPESPAASATLP